MPPLHYDANAKVQQDYDPNLIVLVRRARVRPTLIFQGKVEGDPVVAQAAAPPPAPTTHESGRGEKASGRIRVEPCPHVLPQTLVSQFVVQFQLTCHQIDARA